MADDRMAPAVKAKRPWVTGPALLLAVAALIITPACRGVATVMALLFGLNYEALDLTLNITAGIAWGWYFDRILVWVNNMLKGA